MAWTPITSTQTQAGKIVNQTLMDSIRTDLDDLNTRLNGIGVVSESNIYDDFDSTLFNTRVLSAGVGPEDPYTWLLQGTGAPTLSANPDHYAILAQAGGAADYSALIGSDYKMAFDLSRDHTVVFETRHKSAQSDITEFWTFGFQDQALIGSVNLVKDRSDFIGFIQGTGVANSYRAQTDNGGAGPTIVIDDHGSAATWNILRIEITFAGATQQVEFFVNGTSVGTSTTNITAVRLRPMVGNADGAAARTQHFDYINAYYAARPLST